MLVQVIMKGCGKEIKAKVWWGAECSAAWRGHGGRAAENMLAVAQHSGIKVQGQNWQNLQFCEHNS